MNTAILNNGLAMGRRENKPTTARGRALYFVDWFLNGRPVLQNYDNPNLSCRLLHVGKQ